MKSNWGSLSATLLSILTIICLSVSVCFAEDDWVDYHGTGFKVSIPGNIRVEKTSPVEDFDIFRFFNKEGKQILGAYAGNAPQFPDRVPEDVKLQEGILGGNPLKSAEWTDKDGFRGEFLVRLAPGIPFPVFIHLWYLELNPAERNIAKEILKTFLSDEH
jgi:hypothetical protein